MRNSRAIRESNHRIIIAGPIDMGGGDVQAGNTMNGKGENAHFFLHQSDIHVWGTRKTADKNKFWKDLAGISREKATLHYENTLMKKGDYKWGFRFLLPRSMPATFFYSKTDWIAWQIEVNHFKTGRFSSDTTTRIDIPYRPFLNVAAPSLAVPVEFTRKSEGEQVDLFASLDRSAYLPGDSIKVHLSIGSQLPIARAAGIDIRLIQNSFTKLRTGKVDNHVFEILKQPLVTTESGSQHTFEADYVLNIPVKKPLDLTPNITTRTMNLNYYVKISCDITTDGMKQKTPMLAFLEFKIGSLKDDELARQDQEAGHDAAQGYYRPEDDAVLPEYEVREQLPAYDHQTNGAAPPTVVDAKS